MSKWFDESLERIKKATGTRTQVQLAEILSIRQSSISDAKRRGSVPADWFLKLYRSHGLNPDWLSDGIEPVYLKSGKGKVPADTLISETTAQYGQVPSRSRVIPVSSLAGAFEDGQWVPQNVGELSIPETLYRSALLVVRMEGSAMEPLIRRGAYLGIDEGLRRLSPGDIFAVVVPHQGLMIRRVFFDPENERYILRSEGPGHPELTLPAKEAEERIRGRVAWIMQDM